MLEKNGEKDVGIGLARGEPPDLALQHLPAQLDGLS